MSGKSPLVCAALLLAACYTRESTMVAPRIHPEAGVAFGPDAATPVTVTDFVRKGRIVDLPTSGPASVPGPVAGSRLRPVRWEGGGASAPAWWFDGQLQITCSFQRASDGELRCLPRELIADGPYHDRDAECGPEARVMRRKASACPPPAYALIPGTDSCPDGRAIHQLGPETSVAEIYRISDGGKCFRYDQTRGYQFYRLGELVPPATFVKAVIEAEPATGPLALVFLKGEDGSRQFRSWRDVGGGFDCGLQYAADGKPRCLPLQEQTTLSGSQPDLFADAQCTMPAVATRASTCQAGQGQHYFLRNASRTACPTPVAAFRGKDMITSAFWTSGARPCAPQTPDPRWQYVSLEELPPATLKEGSFAALPGASRLRALAHVTPAGTRASGGFWDPKFATYCTARMASDGVTRCLPSSFDDVELYLDPTCTGPAFVSGGVATSCQISFFSRTIPGSCPPRRSVHPISATPQKLQPLYGQGPLGCGGVSGVEAVHALGPAIAPAEFQELSLVME